MSRSKGSPVASKEDAQSSADSGNSGGESGSGSGGGSSPVTPTDPVTNVDATNGVAASAATATVTATALTRGQAATIDGQTVTAVTDMTADEMTKSFADLLVASPSHTAAAADKYVATTGSSTLTDWTNPMWSGLTVKNGGDGEVSEFKAASLETKAIDAATAPVTAMGDPDGGKPTATVTFKELKVGQSITVCGVTLTAKADMSAAEVATAMDGLFDSVKNATTYLASGSYTAPQGWKSPTHTANNDVITFTNSTTDPVVSTGITVAGSAAITSPERAEIAAAQVVNGGAAVPEATAAEYAVTFKGLAAGQSYTFAGFTVKAAAAMEAADVAAAFRAAINGTATPETALYSLSGNLSTPTGWTGISVKPADTALVSLTSTAKGATASGTFADATADDNAEVAAPSAATATVTDGTADSKAVVEVGFNGLEFGQSYSLWGAKITAKTTMSADEVAGAFASALVTKADSVTSKCIVDADNVTIPDALGTLTASNCTTAGEEGNLKLKVEAADKGATPLGEQTVTAAGIADPAAPGTLDTATFTAGLDATDGKETATYTLTGLSAGQSITLCGVTLTAVADMVAKDVAAALVDALSATPTAAGADATYVVSGTYDTTDLTGWKGIAWTADGTGKLTATNGVAGDVDGTFGAITAATPNIAAYAAPTTSMGALANNHATATVDFADDVSLVAGQSVTVDGMTITAKATMDEATIASAFATIFGTLTDNDASTNPVNTTSYLVSGTYTAPTGWTTPTYAAGGTDNKDLVVTNSGATGNLQSTGITTAGSEAVTAVASTPLTIAFTNGTAEAAATDSFTFNQALSEGEGYKIGGITVTAKGAMTTAEVATAFAAVLDKVANNGSVSAADETGYSVAAGTLNLGSGWTNPTWTASGNVLTVECAGVDKVTDIVAEFVAAV